MNNDPNVSHTIKKISILKANYLFIDGMSRSGKTSLAPVISSFEKVEHFKARATYDRFLMMYESGDLTKQGFKYLFESDLLMDVWFSMMGRDVNHNLHDLTSIMNSPKRENYLAREQKKIHKLLLMKLLKRLSNKS